MLATLATFSASKLNATMSSITFEIREANNIFVEEFRKLFN